MKNVNDNSIWVSLGQLCSPSPISSTFFARFTGIEKQELISPKDKIRYLISIAKNGFTKNSAIFSVSYKNELQNTVKGNSDIWKKGTTELAKKPFRVGVWSLKSFEFLCSWIIWRTATLLLIEYSRSFYYNILHVVLILRPCRSVLFSSLISYPKKSL